MALIVGNDNRGNIVKASSSLGNSATKKSGTATILDKTTTNPNTGKIMGTYRVTKDANNNTQYIKPSTKAEYDYLKGLTDYGKKEDPVYVSAGDGGSNNADYASSAIADYYSQLLADQKALRDSRSATLDSVYNRAKDAYVATNTKNKKALTREYKMLGQNPSQSKLWDMDYNLARYLNDLDIQKNESKADIDSDYYNARNSAMSGILSSGLENSALYNALKKFRGA